MVNSTPAKIMHTKKYLLAKVRKYNIPSRYKIEEMGWYTLFLASRIAFSVVKVKRRLSSNKLGNQTVHSIGDIYFKRQNHK